MNARGCHLTLRMLWSALCVLCAPLVAQTVRYAYDDLNRLLAESHSDGSSVQYAYDEVHNRVALAVSGPSGAPVALTESVAQLVGQSGAMIGYVNAAGSPGLAWFEWGPTPVLGRRTEPTAIGAEPTTVFLRATPDGLSAGQRCYFRVAISNAFGIGYGETSVANSAPPTVINMNQTLAAAQGSGPVALAPIIVTEAYEGELITARLRVLNPDAGAVAGVGGGSYDPLTGCWSVTGTLGRVNTALAQLSFVPGADFVGAVAIATHLNDSLLHGPEDGVISISIKPTPISTTPTVFMVTSHADSGPGSLRQAILDANAHPGRDQIAFNLTGLPAMLQVSSGLPEITDPVIIDGTTAPDYQNSPVIVLDGTQAGPGVPGLTVSGGGSTIRGLVISGFAGCAIALTGGSGNRIQANYLGCNYTGTANASNALHGVYVLDSSLNLIGGADAASANVISGNGNYGVYITGRTSSGNAVQGNLIGVDATGTQALPNRLGGVCINESPSNLIGGRNAATRNVISGNGIHGIYISGWNASGNTIQGNFIGVDVTGAQALANRVEGVYINGSPSNLIGGTNAAMRNVISGNSVHGIYISGWNASGNTIQGNFIGVDVTGAQASPNGNGGVLISDSPSNLIGGTNAAMRNVVSGNGGYGIRIAGTNAVNNVVEGNLVGTDQSGLVAVGNGTGEAPGGHAGVIIQGPRNRVGGETAGARNVISGNSGEGIFLAGSDASSNVIAGNFIGVDATGLKALANSLSGVTVGEAAGNLVGGTSPQAGNVISGNGHSGVFITGLGASGNVIRGNLIGTDVTGTAAVGNAYAGVAIQRAPNNAVGGVASGAGNVVSGNARHGVEVYGAAASGNVIQGNLIGTQVDGASPLGNAWNGVRLRDGANHNLIGGAALHAGNIIAFNGYELGATSGWAGVRLYSTAGSGNAVRGNSVFSNCKLGIDGGDYGVTWNPGSGLQGFPVITEALAGPQGAAVAGHLAGPPSSRVTVDVFSNRDCDNSGCGQGRTYLGSVAVDTDASGSAAFLFLATSGLPADEMVITTTATDAGGNTSEFSQCATLNEDAGPSSPPTGLVTSAVSGQRVDLRWSPAGASGLLPVGGYRVYRDGVPIGTTTAAAYSDVGLPANTTHRYAVATIDVLGAGWNPGPPVDGTTLDRPPVIASVSPNAGLPGIPVTIAGSGFSATPASNTVWVGGVRATVVSASSNVLNVLTPAGASYARISVTTSGLTAYSASPFLATFNGVGNMNSTSLVAALSLPVSGSPTAVALGDLDGDGVLDLAVASLAAKTISVYRGRRSVGSAGSVTFGDKIEFATGGAPLAIALGDLDGDGQPDVVVANGDNMSAEGSVFVFRNSSAPGSITFAPCASFPAGKGSTGVLVLDLDADGKPDIVTADSFGESLSVLGNRSQGTNLAFDAALTLAVEGGARSVTAADLDGDGRSDLIAAGGYSSTNVSIFRNVATNGMFTPGSFAPRVVLPAGSAPYGVATGDFDGDGRPDIAAANFLSNTVSVFRNCCVGEGIGGNSFILEAELAASLAPTSVLVAELDGDGWVDLVVGSGFSRSGGYRPLSSTPSPNDGVISVFSNNTGRSGGAAGLFGPRLDFAVGKGPPSVAQGDVDGDGETDLVVASYEDNTVWLFHNAQPQRPNIIRQPQPAEVLEGDEAQFVIAVQGPGPLAVQWFKNGTNAIPRATNLTLALPRVRATDIGAYHATVSNSNGSATSAAAALIVRGLNGAPIVGMESPTNHALFAAGSDIVLSAVASASSGGVVKVEFFAGGTLLGVVGTPPYAISWTNVSAGEYRLSAVVTDGQGTSACSEAVDISVVVMTGRPHLITQCLLGGSADQNGTAVAVGDGAVYVVGRTAASDGDGLLARFALPLLPGASPSQVVTWPQQPGGDSFKGVAVSSDGVYAAGESYTRTSDQLGDKESKGIAVKFPLGVLSGDGYGGAVWDKQTPAPPGAFSYRGYETLNAVAATLEGGQPVCYVTGNAQSGGANGGRLFLSKVRADSSILWTVTDQATQVWNATSVGRAVAVLNARLYVAGVCYDNSRAQAYLRCYTPAGDLNWSRTAADGTYNGVIGFAGAVFAVGATPAAGGAGSDFLIDKWGEMGNLLWSRSYDRGAAEDSLNGVVGLGTRIYAVGLTRGATAGGADAVILELDPGTGDLLSSTLHGGSQDDLASAVATDGTDLYVAGETRSTVNSQQQALLLRYGINVARTTPIITWANPPSISYGTPLSSAQLSAMASVPGTFKYSPPGGAVLVAGIRGLMVFFEPTDSTHYTVALAYVSLTVTPAKPVITWANPASITYGMALSSTQLNAATDVPGTFSYTPEAGTVLNAGSNQSLTATFTPTDFTNYVAATASVMINVEKGMPRITWANPASITYPTPLGNDQLNATANLPGAFGYTPPAGTILNAGDNQILAADFTPADSMNYNTGSATVSINVAKAGQNITFSALRTRAASEPPFLLEASASSGLPVTFSIVNGPAALSGNTVTLTNVGLVTVRASQGGNSNYLAAPDVDQSFAVTPSGGAMIAWANPAGGDWNVAANWSPSRVPGPSDDVFITANGLYTVTLNPGATIASLTLGGDIGSQTLNTSGGLTLNKASTVNRNGILRLGGGIIAGNSLLTVNGLLDWTGGMIMPGSAVAVQANGALNISGAADKRISGALTNAGTVTWTGAGWLRLDGGRIYNLPGALFDVQNDQAFAKEGGNPVLDNRGTLRKSASGGVTTFQGVRLDNTGVLEVRSGTLSLPYPSGGSNRGTFNAGAGATILVSDYTFGDGSQLSGLGTHRWALGTVTLNGAIAAEHVEWAGAMLMGTNTISGVVHWLSGVIHSSAAVTIATNGTLNLEGGVNKDLNGVLTNAGTVTWTGAGWLRLDGGRIYNLPGALFDVQNDQAFAKEGGNPVLDNRGTLRKSASGGVTTFQRVRLDNTGVLEVRSGTLSLPYPSGGTNRGTFNAGAGATILVSDYTFGDGSQLSGLGTHRWALGTVTLNGAIAAEHVEWAGAMLMGTNRISGVVHWLSGVIHSSAAVTIATNGTLNLEGNVDKHLNGVLTNAGTMTWTGEGRLKLDGGRIYNLSGALFNVQNDQAFLDNGGNPAFNNEGTFRKSAGSGTTTFDRGTFNNTGTLDVQKGTVYLSGGYTLTGGTLSFGISSPTDFGRINLFGSATLAGAISANFNQGFSPSADSSFVVLTYGSESGVFAQSNLPLLPPGLVWQTEYGSSAFTLKVLNEQPAMAPISDQVVDELVPLTVAISAAEPGLPPEALTFALVSSPNGMTINPGTGLIVWTPTEAQGPSTNTIVVQVSDNRVPPRSDTKPFAVTVNEINRAPSLDALSDCTVAPGETLSFAAAATDPDLPANPLAFSLVSSPAGANLEASTGLFNWRPAMAQANTTNLVQVQVTDSNPWDVTTPQLSDTKAFTVIVKEVTPVTLTPILLSGGKFQVQISGAVGPDYILQTSTTLTSWINLWTNTPTAMPISFTDTNTASFSRRYYRAVLGP